MFNVNNVSHPSLFLEISDADSVVAKYSFEARDKDYKRLTISLVSSFLDGTLTLAMNVGDERSIMLCNVSSLDGLTEKMMTVYKKFEDSFWERGKRAAVIEYMASLKEIFGDRIRRYG